MLTLLLHHSTGKQWTIQKELINFFKIYQKIKVSEECYIYCSVVYGICVTKSWRSPSESYF